MVFASLLAALALVATPVFGAPVAMHTVQRFSGTTIKNDYIVTYNSGAEAAREETVNAMGSKVKAAWPIMNAFSATFDAHSLRAMRANPNVASIEEDGIYNIFTTVTQTNAPWGLARLSRVTPLPPNTNVDSITNSYTFDDSAGAGVDVYVIDTGILTTHAQFQGRASWGATFGGYADADGNGHGTHCAGTVAGSRFGVAKAASLIAVKVLSDDGSGSITDIISGLNFVRKSAQVSGRPSVASLSLGGGKSASIDSAVAGVTSAGVHVVVAAGNEAADVDTTSPARAASAITVGAVDITDNMAKFSNFGSGVDVLAPGVSVISSTIGSNIAIASLTGTSMATPHIAGLVAYLIGLDGDVSPADMSTKMKTLAIDGAISKLAEGTANTLANNGVGI